MRRRVNYADMQYFKVQIVKSLLHFIWCEAKKLVNLIYLCLL